MAAFAKYGSPLTAGQIDAERIAAGVTKNAIDDERGELRRRGILAFSHDGSGHDVGTGRPLWALAHAEGTPVEVSKTYGVTHTHTVTQ